MKRTLFIGVILGAVIGSWVLWFPLLVRAACTPLGTTTAILGLCKPATGELSWGTAVNANYDILDGFFAGASILKVANGGTSLSTSGTDGSKALMSDGSGGMTMKAPGGVFVMMLTGSVPAQQFVPVSGQGDNSQALEDNTAVAVPVACTAGNLFVRTNTGGVGTATVTVRKNKADTAITVNVTATASTTFSDTTHLVSFAQGDRINYSFTGANTAQIISLALKC